MTIEEAKALERDLLNSIVGLLEAFEATTGLRVVKLEQNNLPEARLIKITSALG